MPTGVQPARGRGGGPMAAAQALLHYQWRAAVLPVNLLLAWTQYLTTALVHALMACGLYTEGRHSQKQQYRDALASVDQFSRREEVYRRRIEELQGESETRLRDKRKALAKLHRARGELSTSQSGIVAEEVAPEIEEAVGEVPDGWSLHGSFACACLAVVWFWCQAETPSLSRKLSSAIFFPEVVAYVLGALLQKSSNLQHSARTAIHCGCWFLTGFIFSHWLLGRN